MDKAEEKPDQFENILDHFADDSWPAMDKVYYDLKVAISVLSPVIRNRLRGLPDYVLDYSDVIPSNTCDLGPAARSPFVLPCTGSSGQTSVVLRWRFQSRRDFPWWHPSALSVHFGVIAAWRRCTPCPW
jgi:hypothetical protein